MCLRKQSEEHTAYKKVRRTVTRFFHLVEKNEVCRKKKYYCKPIPGSRAMHSVSSVSHKDVTLLKVRDLACFCKNCMDENSDFCVNASHVQPWKLITLEPKSIAEPIYRNPTNFKDDWENHWYEGDMLLQGFYYERLSARQRGAIISQCLVKDKYANVYSHHVICSGFAMLPNYTKKELQRYSMSSEIRAEIVNALECRSSLNV